MFGSPSLTLEHQDKTEDITNFHMHNLNNCFVYLQICISIYCAVITLTFYWMVPRISAKLEHISFCFDGAEVQEKNKLLRAR